MADPALTRPKNFIEVLELITRVENPSTNSTYKGYALQTLECQRTHIGGAIIDNKELQESLNTPQQSGRKALFESLTIKRDNFADTELNNADIAVQMIKDRLPKLSGAKEKLEKLDLAKLDFSEARKKIFSVLQEVHEDTAHELFKGNMKLDPKDNEAMTTLMEAAVQISYANSVIDSVRQKAKVQDVAKTARADTNISPGLKVVDAVPASTPPLTGNAPPVVDPAKAANERK